MKRLEDLKLSKFTQVDFGVMRNLFGGEAKPTALIEGATLKRYANGCSQADKNENDKQTLVGDVMCPQPKDTTSVITVCGENIDIVGEECFNIDGSF